MIFNKRVTQCKRLIVETIGIAITAFMLTSCGYAQDSDSYNDWDSDNDNKVTQDEFDANMKDSEVYEDWDSWDLDNDNALSENEMGEGLYGSWDANNDDLLDEKEYNKGSVVWLIVEEPSPYSSLDKNNDVYVDYDEFYVLLTDKKEDKGLFSNWDKDGDGLFDEKELFEGFFGVFDNDNNDYLDNNEFEKGPNRWPYKD